MPQCVTFQCWNVKLPPNFAIFLFFSHSPQPETEQGRRTSLEKFTRSVVSVPFPRLLTLKLRSLKCKEFWCTSVLFHIPGERRGGQIKAAQLFWRETGAVKEKLFSQLVCNTPHDPCYFIFSVLVSTHAHQINVFKQTSNCLCSGVHTCSDLGASVVMAAILSPSFRQRPYSSY